MNEQKILITYFSRASENKIVGDVLTGNTEILAKLIAKKTKGDLFRIEPVNSYPESFQAAYERAGKEKDLGILPGIKHKIENLNDYDVIFLGYPVWRNDLPMIINNFIKSYDFSGKTIVPFCTHEGSKNAGTYQKIQNYLPDAKVIGGGYSIKGSKVRTEKGRKQTLFWLDFFGF